MVCINLLEVRLHQVREMLAHEEGQVHMPEVEVVEKDLRE